MTVTLGSGRAADPLASSMAASADPPSPRLTRSRYSNMAMIRKTCTYRETNRKASVTAERAGFMPFEYNAIVRPMQPEGHIHPLSRTIREICSVFFELGFEAALGPELEDEYHNFDALNIPADHPSRDMQDTFWVKGEGRRLLATQTSAIQIRYMEAKKKAGVEPPFRVIAPGKVFRNEATDATHEAQFFQLEGLYVDRRVSLAHLKGVLERAFKAVFGDRTGIRFRPSYFPFVEPAVEVDAEVGGKWLEVLGAGLVHPKVLEAGGLDPAKWQGLAFAFGIDRIVMLKHGIDDIRLLYGGDLRFSSQF
ncbi:MAG: phenylalanine--tRNA ligase subunit alpha [Cyanobacteria bacterium REEB65]|nr:phenylalanine--tRNA ligase subunit alpha [Cyanobacteria bacterium REEB65]